MRRSHKLMLWFNVVVLCTVLSRALWPGLTSAVFSALLLLPHADQCTTQQRLAHIPVQIHAQVQRLVVSLLAACLRDAGRLYMWHGRVQCSKFASSAGQWSPTSAELVSRVIALQLVLTVMLDAACSLCVLLLLLLLAGLARSCVTLPVCECCRHQWLVIRHVPRLSTVFFRQYAERRHAALGLLFKQVDGRWLSELLCRSKTLNQHQSFLFCWFNKVFAAVAAALMSQLRVLEH
jgi:hypothetical protein